MAPPASANLAEIPVPAPAPTIGLPCSIWACSRASTSWRVYLMPVLPLPLAHPLPRSLDGDRALRPSSRRLVLTGSLTGVRCSASTGSCRPAHAVADAPGGDGYRGG